jgi:hypothetical protein
MSTTSIGINTGTIIGTTIGIIVGIITGISIATTLTFGTGIMSIGMIAHSGEAAMRRFNGDLGEEEDDRSIVLKSSQHDEKIA